MIIFEGNNVPSCNINLIAGDESKHISTFMAATDNILEPIDVSHYNSSKNIINYKEKIMIILYWSVNIVYRSNVQNDQYSSMVRYI